MPDIKISNLQELTSADAEDLIPIIDISETDLSKRNKKIKYSSFVLPNSEVEQPTGINPADLVSVDTLSGYIEQPNNKTYTVQLFAFTSYRIVSIAARTNSGSCQIILQKNDLATKLTPTTIGINSGLSVYTNNNSSNYDYVREADRLTLTVDNVLSTEGLSFSIKILKDHEPKVDPNAEPLN